MFSTFKLAVQKQFNIMKTHSLYRVELNKDKLWEVYLNSFPVGTNPIFKERTEHDCNCCKSFIRAVGNMVAIIKDKDGKDKLVSIWDVSVDNFYQDVANALSKFVKDNAISDLFLSPEATVGTDKTFQQMIDKELRTWNHFHIQLPKDFVCKGADIASKLGWDRTTKEVMDSSLQKINLEAVDTVLELISQNSLYRGSEHKFAVESFRKLVIGYNAAENKDLFCWANFKTIPESVSRIKGTVIGTLLTDISEGYELEDCLKSFEQKVAPANYKRPTAPVTKVMIEKAKEKITELGYMPSLDRRPAALKDISINNVIFADRSAKKLMVDVFDDLASQTSAKVKTIDKVEEISIEDFIKNVLPKVDSVEIMFENKHAGNLVSLITAVNPTAPSMFKWSNSFSWSYAGELADSIKERVKKAGGKVDGDLRCSLSWFNYDDLDFHMIEPNNYEIYFSNRNTKSPSGGMLDVDMNAGGGRRGDSSSSRSAVENICYTNRKTMKEGIYKLVVNNYVKVENVDFGFEVEVEFDGIIHTFAYPTAVRNKENVTVAEIKYSISDGFSIIKSISSVQATKTVWNLPTQTFHKVSAMMLSPNFWDDKSVGNKHYFFMLEGCLNDDKMRGFYNEFLSSELDKHRKVFEMVGSKMVMEGSNDQLSGLGFSSTQRNSILCRVKGNFTRTLKINF
jgi:hypothetical protein